MTYDPSLQWGPPPGPEARPPAARPALWVAGILLLVLVFSAGLVVGQSGGVGSDGTALRTPAPVATPAPTTESPTHPDETLAPRATPTEPAETQPPIVTAPPGPTPSQPADAPRNFGLFWEALEVIRKNFVGRDDLAEGDLTYGAIRGLVEELGDTGHSVFLTPEALLREKESLGGTIVGVGALLGERGGRPVIVSVISGGPAQRSGLRSGDLLITVDGVDVERMTPEEVATRVRGEEGSTVVIVVDRPASGERLEFSIVREEIRVPTATWAMVPGTTIALLRLVQFSEGASDQLRTARDDAVAQGAQSLILDLRSNPGGFVHEAVRVAGLFIEGQTVYIREMADGQRVSVETCAPAGSDSQDICRAVDEQPPTGLPLVVLIDEGTASSAEIVSGALRSAGRADLVGETTFGTGTVLLTFELSDGSALRIAIERWLTPDGELIFDQGISPTVEVELGPTENPLQPDELRELSPADVANLADPQLLRAVQLLGGPGAGAAPDHSGALSRGPR
jgi:carboxyl-terminal processing protease